MESLERKLYFVNKNILDQAGLQKLFCRGALKCQMPLGACEKLFGVGAQSLNVSVFFSQLQLTMMKLMALLTFYLPTHLRWPHIVRSLAAPIPPTFTRTWVVPNGP